MAYRKKWFFYTREHPQNHEDFIKAEFHKVLDGDQIFCNREDEPVQSVNGLVYLTVKRIECGRLENVLSIFNPSNGQQVTLPRPETTSLNMRGLFLYDSIKDEHHVLLMNVYKYRHDIKTNDHQVLTIGTKIPKWRKINCSLPHYPFRNGIWQICIDGTVYYKAWIDHSSRIASFNVRTEQFTSIELPKGPMLNANSDLINYNGRLGYLHSYNTQRELWVLQGNKSWEEVSGWPETDQKCKTIWVNSEICWFPYKWTNPYFAQFYNPETGVKRQVEMKGLEGKSWGETLSSSTMSKI